MINDLTDSLSDVQTSLFADDSCVFKCGKDLKSITKKVQDNLNEISNWCDQWGFKISVEKNDCSCVYTQQTRQNENSAKFLGLTFDSKLSWSAHIKYIEDKCKKRLNLMRAVSGNTWGASKKTLLTIYRALIRSVIDYGAIAYNTATESVKHRLDIIQQKAQRIACGSFCTTAASALQVETAWGTPHY